jgi:hypothetical protein
MVETRSGLTAERVEISPCTGHENVGRGNKTVMLSGSSELVWYRESIVWPGEIAHFSAPSHPSFMSTTSRFQKSIVWNLMLWCKDHCWVCWRTKIRSAVWICLFLVGDFSSSCSTRASTFSWIQRKWRLRTHGKWLSISSLSARRLPEAVHYGRHSIVVVFWLLWILRGMCGVFGGNQRMNCWPFSFPDALHSMRESDHNIIDEFRPSRAPLQSSLCRAP